MLEASGSGEGSGGCICACGPLDQAIATGLNHRGEGKIRRALREDIQGAEKPQDSAIHTLPYRANAWFFC